jgi:hypothetical protein
MMFANIQHNLNVGAMAMIWCSAFHATILCICIAARISCGEGWRIEYFGWPVLHVKNEKAKPQDDDDGSKNQAGRQTKKIYWKNGSPGGPSANSLVIFWLTDDSEWSYLVQGWREPMWRNEEVTSGWYLASNWRSRNHYEERTLC